jgi:hypothetical protein
MNPWGRSGCSFYESRPSACADVAGRCTARLGRKNGPRLLVLAGFDMRAGQPDDDFQNRLFARDEARFSRWRQPLSRSSSCASARRACGKGDHGSADVAFAGLERQGRWATQRLTVTRKNVAGMEVPPFLLWFCMFANSTSWLWSSATFPFFSAASKAFIVGP